MWGSPFRVFNKKTLVVEEITHVVFDESDPKVTRVEEEVKEGVIEVTQGVESANLEERVEPVVTLPRE